MKPLHELNYVEKGKLLHELFPEETVNWIDFLKNVTDSLTNDPQQITENWSSTFVSYEHWKKLTEVVQQKLATHGTEMKISSRLFGDQLFNGYSAMYCSHYLKVYVMHKNHLSREFNLAIEMFFGMYPLPSLTETTNKK